MSLSVTRMTVLEGAKPTMSQSVAAAAGFAIGLANVRVSC